MVMSTALLGLLALPAGAQELTPESVQSNLDLIFVFLAAVLVILMQAGFALVEAGLTRAKNVSNIMMKNLMDFSGGVLVFFAFGYALAYGESGTSFIGTNGFFLTGIEDAYGSPGALAVSFLFQVAFAATAATIVSGAMAERTKFKAYFFYSLAITGLIYPLVVRWTWGGGWLNDVGNGLIDFAGSTIVHSVGGWAALMGALILGPRLGKYGKDGKPRAIPGHSIPFVVLGTMILLIGWYGFNPGSELAADDMVPYIAVTTTLAAVAGAVGAMATIWIKTGKPDVAMTANGLLAGLVSITAGTAAVSYLAAIAMGLIGGVLVVFSVLFFDRIRIDDPVGAISVHGVCGAWGTLAVGLFATNGGLFHGGGFSQLATQAVAVITVFVWVTVTSGLVFLILRATIGLRVSEEEEVSGLDVLEHGAPGYGFDPLATISASRNA
jgi:Amt family ammonium transporter